MPSRHSVDVAPLATSMLAPPGPRVRPIVPGSLTRMTLERTSLTESNNGDQAFYSKLLLYSVLEPYKGRHAERQHSRDGVDVTGTLSEMRRDFLDKISYLCDTEKGGATVTAAALQSLPRGNILWLAANEGVEPETEKFVNTIVREIATVNVSNAKTIEDSIFLESVRRAFPRLSFYRRQMVRLAKQCRDAIKTSLPANEDAVKLRGWLKKLKNIRDHIDLAQICYDARSNQIPHLLRLTSGQNDYFATLAHSIGRLGAHRHAVRKIIIAAMHVPSIRQIHAVRSEVCPLVKVVTLAREALEPYTIVRKICVAHNMHPASAQQSLIEFVKRDLESNSKDNMTKSGVILTRVHAELLLVDLFSRRNFDFVAGDKYIGCSKGACYFCAQYISMHHKNFVSPAAHNKVLVGVRGPEPDSERDVHGRGARLAKRLEERVSWKVEQDILASLRQGANLITFQHCSSNGSSRAPSVMN